MDGRLIAESATLPDEMKEGRFGVVCGKQTFPAAIRQTDWPLCFEPVDRARLRLQSLVSHADLARFPAGTL